MRSFVIQDKTNRIGWIRGYTSESDCISIYKLVRQKKQIFQQTWNVPGTVEGRKATNCHSFLNHFLRGKTCFLLLCVPDAFCLHLNLHTFLYPDNVSRYRLHVNSRCKRTYIILHIEGQTSK